MATEKATEKATKMATENEKLCMAIVTNATITHIDWRGVADELGIDKIPTVQKRWSRFKTAKFGSAAGSPGGAAASSTDTTPVKKGKAAGKKRAAEEIETDEYAVAKVVRPRTNKTKTPRKPTAPVINDDDEIHEENGAENGHDATDDVEA